MKRLHLIISGRVQGVAFRAYTEKEAYQLNLTGWVRNLPDGKVEVLAEGQEKSLKKLKAWCQHGPPSAQVNHISFTWSETTGEFDGFSIR